MPIIFQLNIEIWSQIHERSARNLIFHLLFTSIIRSQISIGARSTKESLSLFIVISYMYMAFCYVSILYQNIEQQYCVKLSPIILKYIETFICDWEPILPNVTTLYDMMTLDKNAYIHKLSHMLNSCLTSFWIAHLHSLTL